MLGHNMVGFRISVVCTANRFRSPAAAACMRVKLAEFGVSVDSMASAGPSGAPAISQVVAQMAERGVDLSLHRSTAWRPGLLGESDLVVCFEGQHAAVAIVEAGAPRERTFLLQELLDLLPAVRLGTPPLGVRDVHARLDRAGRFRTGDFFDPRYQYPDPMEGPTWKYRTRVTEIADLSERLACRVFGLREVGFADFPPPARGGFLRRHRDR